MATSSETGYTPGSYPAERQPLTTPTFADRYSHELSRAVDQNPSGTLMSAFGIGLGIGALVGLGIAFSVPRPKPRTRAEEFGQRMLDMFGDYVPDSVARRFS